MGSKPDLLSVLCNGTVAGIEAAMLVVVTVDVVLVITTEVITAVVVVAANGFRIIKLSE